MQPEQMNIQWYPGHMTKTRRQIEADLKQVDAVCEIVDARIPFASRNPDIDSICGHKRGEIALTYVYGIGRSSSAKILEKAGVDKDLKVKDWTDDQAAKIREIIGAEYKVEGDLRSEVQLNIKRLMDIGCYRGVRHRIGLPVRGQSTKNNARTRKGRKKTVANKKKATK